MADRWRLVLGRLPDSGEYRSLLDLWGETGGTARQLLAALTSLADDRLVAVHRFADGWTLARRGRGLTASTAAQLPRRLALVTLSAGMRPVAQLRIDGDRAVLVEGGADGGRRDVRPARAPGLLLTILLERALEEIEQVAPGVRAGAVSAPVLTFVAGAGRDAPLAHLQVRAPRTGAVGPRRTPEDLTVEHLVGAIPLRSAARFAGQCRALMWTWCAYPKGEDRRQPEGGPPGAAVRAPHRSSREKDGR